MKIQALIISLLITGALKAAEDTRTATVEPADIEGFSELPATVRETLGYALTLTSRNLSYKPGSADPDAGGTDCSGFVYHILQKHGYANTPRQSDHMYRWVWEEKTFRACNGTTADTFEFAELRPGDLLFWVNSTRDGKTTRNPPVTHVMIYLGKRKSDGRPLAAGASEGRTFDGERMYGVSVFDFKLPDSAATARFIGYAHLPEKKTVRPATDEPKNTESKKTEPKPAGTAKAGAKKPATKKPEARKTGRAK